MIPRLLSEVVYYAVLGEIYPPVHYLVARVVGVYHTHMYVHTQLIKDSAEDTQWL